MKKIYVVGIGPGSFEHLTQKAVKALEESTVILGYTVYVDLIKEYFSEKNFITTPMKKEIERCKIALEEADKGQIVSLVCSGDAGIYGMSGLVYELAPDYKEVEIEVVPGITAAVSGASLLGAPFMHDFAVISLSDLLTPWEKIKNRLEAAARADFVICLYNPSSKKRGDYLQKACDIILCHQPRSTICGLVRNISRDGEMLQIMTLEELRNTAVDMFTTVYIGNTETRVVNGKMVTPRGYIL